MIHNTNDFCSGVSSSATSFFFKFRSFRTLIVLPPVVYSDPPGMDNYPLSCRTYLVLRCVVLRWRVRLEFSVQDLYRIYDSPG